MNKNIWKFILKIVISTLLIIWILSGIEYETAFKTLQKGNIILLLIAFSFYGVQMYFRAYKYKYIIKVQDIDIPKKKLYRFFLYRKLLKP